MSVVDKIKAAAGVDSLSNRQREILRLVARHHRVKEIARILQISEATVRTHTEEARRRLGATTSREAAIALLRHESGDGALSHEALLPETDLQDVSSAGSQAAPVFEEQFVDTKPAAEAAAAQVEGGRFARWLKQRSLLECVGIILLIALGLSVLLVSLVAAAATTIQAIQNLTGQTQ